MRKKCVRNIQDRVHIMIYIYSTPLLCILIFLKFIPTLISFLFFSPPINCIKSRVRDDSRVLRKNNTVAQGVISCTNS